MRSRALATGNTARCWQAAASGAGTAEVEREHRTAQHGAGARQAKDVVLEYYAAYNAGDVDAILALMAPDCRCARCAAAAARGCAALRVPERWGRPGRCPERVSASPRVKGAVGPQTTT